MFSKLVDQVYNALEFIQDLEEIDVPFELTITFLNDKAIQNLNREYRNINKVTDVLSFPVFENKNTIKSFDNSYPILLGDIFLNVNQATKQAQEIGNTLEEELLYLTIHSILHLLGYDHLNEANKKEMRTIEKKIFKRSKKLENRE